MWNSGIIADMQGAVHCGRRTTVRFTEEEDENERTEPS